MAEETCGGTGCTCAPREDGFCSDHCKEHAAHDREGHSCQCGHAGCGAAAAT